MNILLPERFDRKMMYTLIAQVIDEKYIPRYPSIAFDLQSLQFIRPSGVTVLSNLIQWLVKRGVHVVVSYPETSRGKSGKINPIKYLDDSGFFELYVKTKVFPESRLRTTTLP